MKCKICGRFMNYEGENHDPENLEDAVWNWWYCAKCNSHQPEHLYYKSSIPDSQWYADCH